MLDSITRTVVPLIVGHLLAWAAMIGLNLPGGAVTEIVAVILTTAYYALARWVEQRWPGLGRVLLSAGLARRQAPLYLPPGATIVIQGRVEETTGEHWPRPGER
ncbi:hypothetical protein [Actinoallomurus sp. CA-142502]|uniref:hypothetical protein n=1 Tax=Actinoallomurus sp. CA-142502 TaxID=3239885 RepID=UPI003D89CD8C